jgi:phosphoribosylformylglycinamidine cyclo-ligase
MTDQSQPSAYAASGVNIDAGNRAVDLLKAAVHATHGPAVLAGVGSFGGLYSAAALQSMNHPVLVASTDGVGTKVKLAAQLGQYASIGQDIVNHCANDILVQGARPLFFLDYIASSRLVPEMVAEVVGGMAIACQQLGCALLGGETAEMPGVYATNEFDVAGTIIGVVEHMHMLPKTTIAAGDVLIGLASSGPHTNGYSLIRRVFANADLQEVLPDGQTLAAALLAPHRAYGALLLPLFSQFPIKALVHLTGGGFYENIPRVLPPGLGAVIERRAWPVPALFQRIQTTGQISTAEMHRVFNMGIGLIAIVPPDAAAAFQAALPEQTWQLGQVLANGGEITLI